MPSVLNMGLSMMKSEFRSTSNIDLMNELKELKVQTPSRKPTNTSLTGSVLNRSVTSKHVIPPSQKRVSVLHLEPQANFLDPGSFNTRKFSQNKLIVASESFMAASSKNEVES